MREEAVQALMDENNSSTRLLSSQDYPEKLPTTERPKGPWKGDYVKSIVYAGLDAIVTCFALISSISAGHLSSGDPPIFKIPISQFYNEMLSIFFSWYYLL